VPQKRNALAAFGAAVISDIEVSFPAESWGDLQLAAGGVTTWRTAQRFVRAEGRVSVIRTPVAACGNGCLPSWAFVADGAADGLLNRWRMGKAVFDRYTTVFILFVAASTVRPLSLSAMVVSGGLMERESGSAAAPLLPVQQLGQLECGSALKRCGVLQTAGCPLAGTIETFHGGKPLTDRSDRALLRRRTSRCQDGHVRSPPAGTASRMGSDRAESASSVAIRLGRETWF